MFKKLIATSFLITAFFLIAPVTTQAIAVPAFLVRPTLLVAPTTIVERIEAGKTENAFSIFPKGAQRFAIQGNPTSQAGITWSKTQGTFQNNKKEEISLLVAANTPAGTYTGNATVVDPDNLQKTYPITVRVTVTTPKPKPAKINQVSFIPCTSTSCQWYTTVIVDGTNFTPQSRVELSYKTSKHNEDTKLNYWLGDAKLVGGNGSTQIVTDFYYLPKCRTYDVKVYAPGANSDTKKFALTLPCS